MLEKISPDSNALTIFEKSSKFHRPIIICLVFSDFVPFICLVFSENSKIICLENSEFLFL